MVFYNPINIATATMEEIYERLCWVYAALRSTVIFDAIGNSYQLSVITQLTRGKIPYPERFCEMHDYIQTGIIQNLQTKDLLCTKSDWARIGRLYHTMPEYYDDKGQELYISMEGAPLREPEIIAKHLILQLSNFPIYLLAAANAMIGKIVTNAFDVIAPPARVSVFFLHELQRTEAVFQNMLCNNRSAVEHNLLVAMKSPITNFDDFATFRQKTSIAYSIWERANGMQYDQQTADWTAKLVEYQIEAAEKLEQGTLRDQLLRAYGRLWTKSIEAQPASPIAVMNRIEKIFLARGDLKSPNNHFLVRTGNPMPPATGLRNRQFKLVSSLNPIKMGNIALWFEAWDFYRNPNRDLNKARPIAGLFTAAVVMPASPQPLYAPREPRPIELISQGPREEPLQVISKPSEADNVQHDDSPASNINSSIRVSLIPAKLVGKMVIGRCDSPPRELTPYLNGNGMRQHAKVVPVPNDSFGPLKTESPISAKSVETIRLYGRKEASNELPIPEMADHRAKVPMAQAELAVSPFKTRPNLYARNDSTSKKVQKIKMKKPHGKENRYQRSLVHVRQGVSVSDSEDDLHIDGSPTKAKRPAAKSLPFGSSPAKRNAVVTTEVKVHKPKYDPPMQQQQRNQDVERHDKLRSEYATHKMSSSFRM